MIKDSVFLGYNTHYFVKLETGEEAEIVQESKINSIIAPGTKVKLTLNMEKINVFDKETGLSLMTGISHSLDLPGEVRGGQEVQ